MNDLDLAKRLFGGDTAEEKAHAATASSASIIEMLAVTSSTAGEVVVRSIEETDDSIWDSGTPGVDFIELDENGDFDEEPFDNVDEEIDLDETPLDMTDGDGANIEGDTETAAFTVSEYHAQAMRAVLLSETDGTEDPVPGEDASITDEIDNGDASDVTNPGSPADDDPVPDESFSIAEITDAEYTAVDDNDQDESDEPIIAEVSDGATIVDTTVSVKQGDRVLVSVQDGKMTVIGVVGGGDEANANLDIAQETANEAIEAAAEAAEDAAAAAAAATSAQENATKAQQAADAASNSASQAVAKADEAKKDVAGVSKAVDDFRKEVGTNLETITNTMKADYAKKTEVSGAIVDAKAELNTAISQNAASIESHAKSIESIGVQIADANGEAAAAKAAAEAATAASNAASTAAANAKSAADAAAADLVTAKQKLQEVESNANANAADIATAKAAVETAQKAADDANKAASDANTAANNAAKAAKEANDGLSALESRVTTAETAITQKADSIELNAVKSTVEDVQATANSANEQAAALKIMADSISSLVTDSNGSSMMEQNADGITWSFNAGKIQDAVEDANKNIEEVKQGLEDKTAYITMSTDENGSPCMELGKRKEDGSTPDFRVRITDNSLDFFEGTEKVAWMDNKSMHINKAAIEDELTIADSNGGFIWKQRENGNLGLTWIGGSN